MNIKNLRTLPPEREIRAFYNDDFIRIYQAYSDEIANSAIQHNSFLSPPFKMTRMTWIKPSFLWMMYRAGWGGKDSNQKRILAIDLSHEGFLWALQNGCLSSFNPKAFKTKEEWEERKNISPVVIQWDPERDIFINKLNYRSIQIGLSGDAVYRYTTEWILHITDITDLANQIKSKIDQGNLDYARELTPKEAPYTISPQLSMKIGMTIQA